MRPVYHVRNRIGGELSPPFRLHTIDEARLVAWRRAHELRLPTFEVAPWEVFERMKARDGIYVVCLTGGEDVAPVSASTFGAWPMRPA